MTMDLDLPTEGQVALAEFGTEGVDITERKDGGVIKVVKRPGIAGETPMIGDKVSIHYTGRLLTGKVFDCSRKCKESFTFNVGKGQVLKAWDIGVLTMQSGELCTLLCRPEYAYGSSGNPDKIPPDSLVLFEVELLKFEGEKLTEDAGIVRRIKVKGEGFTSPNDGATVDIHLVGSCDGRVFDCRDVRFVISDFEDNNIPVGVDRAMDKMQKGECCILYLKPKYGFGSHGKPEFKIGPDKDLVYEVTLKDFKKAKEFWELDLQEKLNLAPEIKQKGNQHCKVGQYYSASIQYQRIVTWLEMECGIGPEQQQRIRDFVMTAHLNLALCFLRLKEYTQVVENCNKALEIEEKNEKALYRRGEARLLRNEYHQAMADFQKVLEVNFANRAARSQIALCQRKIKESDEQDKRTYANMFKKLAEPETKVGKLKREGGLRCSLNGDVKRRRRSQDFLSHQ
ncbi:peptidyl-prolyl cis-trans isomerase FKBP5 [Neosynchiropus ocellatus]